MRALFLGLCLLAVPSCFQVDEPPCAYSCADDGKCPEHYVCASDNYCHRTDYTGLCTYGGVDQAVGNVSADLSFTDAASSD